VSGTHLGPLTNFSFSLKFCLDSCGLIIFCSALSDEREQVCNLLLLLVLARAVSLRSESHGSQDHILLSQFLGLPQPGRPGPCIYIPQEQGGPVIPLDTRFPFSRLLRLAGTTVEVFYPASTREMKCVFVMFLNVLPHGIVMKENKIFTYF
jgi:hypothetical protein